VLRKAGEQGWRDRIPIGNRRGYSFSIPDRDDNGHRALSDLRSRALNGAANADAADEPDGPGQFLVPADHVRHHIADAPAGALGRAQPVRRVQLTEQRMGPR
jgi:hypothetical protein